MADPIVAGIVRKLYGSEPAEACRVVVMADDMAQPEPHVVVFCTACSVTLLERPASDGAISLTYVNEAAAAHEAAV